jgi:3-oxoacyl-[acyl-carrier-protein] synthase III
MMIRAKIIGTGSYLPKKILNNAYFEKIVDTSDEWITSRTGIEERHIAEENEKTSDMAFIAAERALKSANISSDKIDLILVATITPDMSFPSVACLIQDRLQTQNCMAMDINAACTGFIYGLHMANSFIQTKQAKNVLIIACDKLSAITDYTDRNTCILFGDGAGAAVLTASDDDTGILGIYTGSDGSKAELLKRHSGLTRQPFNRMGPYDYHNMYLYMDGKAIFKSAVTQMTSSLGRALELAGKKREDLDMIIPHQANVRIIKSVQEYAKVTDDKIYISLPRTGNTSASTIPIAMDDAIKNGKLNAGQLVGLTAFGAGLTFGAAVIKL